MYLIDTNVLSALSPSRRSDHAELAHWLDEASKAIFLASVSAAEISAGIAKAERLGALAKVRGLRDWWESIQFIYGGRFLPLDLDIASVMGEMVDTARAHDPGFVDIAIAATARVHKLTVLTRNERHFLPLNVSVHNPFRGLPPLG